MLLLLWFTVSLQVGGQNYILEVVYQLKSTVADHCSGADPTEPSKIILLTAVYAKDTL